MTHSELIQKVMLHHRWLDNPIYGEQLILDGKDLRGLNLRYSDLRNAVLVDCDLRGADFMYCNLTWADLRKSKLTDTNFRHAKLQHTSVRYIELIKAILSKSLRMRLLSYIDQEG